MSRNVVDFTIFDLCAKRTCIYHSVNNNMISNLKRQPICAEEGKKAKHARTPNQTVAFFLFNPLFFLVSYALTGFTNSTLSKTKSMYTLTFAKNCFTRYDANTTNIFKYPVITIPVLNGDSSRYNITLTNIQNEWN